MGKQEKNQEIDSLGSESSFCSPNCWCKKNNLQLGDKLGSN